MPSYRFQRGGLALAAALATLAACSDTPRATGPATHPRHALGAGDVVTVTSTSGGTDVGSLRWALGLTTGGETIRFDPAIAGATIVLDTTLVITRTVTIEGPTDRGITLSGGGAVRVLEIATGPFVAPVTLRNVSITGGKAPAGNSGGGIRASSDIVLDHVTVSGNEAGAAAAMLVQGLTLVNSTVSANVSTGSYPAIITGRRTVVENSTIAHNSPGGLGGASPTILRNSIVAANGTGPNCAGAVANYTREGRNLADDDSCGDLSTMLIAEARLDSLRDNGGPGMTNALLAASPALDAGEACTVSEDQRYVARGERCDIGAFEFIDFTAVALGTDPGASVSPVNGWVVVSGAAQCSRDERIALQVDVEQPQRVGRGQAVVRGTGTATIDCRAAGGAWSVAVAPAGGSFAAGAANVTARTAETARWVTPASITGQVRLFWGKR